MSRAATAATRLGRKRSFPKSNPRNHRPLNPSKTFSFCAIDATRAARRVIADALTKTFSRVAYWLDLGNNASSGQYVLGQPLNARNRRKADRLRLVSELYPEIIDTTAGEDPLPSCSAVEALERQEPFINLTLAASALAMLARLFRYGRLRHHGAFFSSSSGLMTAIAVDPDQWKRTRAGKRKFDAGRSR